MRVRFSKALLLSMGVLFGTGTAMAQSGSYNSPSLLALPETGPQLPALAPVSYNTTAAPNSSNSYGLASSRRAADDAYRAPTDEEVSSGGAQSPVSNVGGPSCSGAGYGWDNNGKCGCSACGCGTFEQQCGNWFGSVGGLIMTRNHANPYWTSYQTNNNPNQLMNTKDASAGWQGGGEFTVGYWFGCPCACGPRTGIEFDYFTIGHLNGSSLLTRAGSDISTPIDLGGVNIGAQTAGQFFDNAHQHGIWRSDEIHNLELNFLEQQCRSNCGVNCTWLAGVRYFRFNETVNFGAASIGTDFGDNGGVDSAFMRFRVDNSLIGPQIGLKAEYNLTPRFGLYAIPKMGIYGNSIDSNMQLYRGDGLQVYNINGHKNDFSFMAQLDLGATYQISPRMKLYGGYRLIGISQLALGDDQFLPFLADTTGYAAVKSNGDLLLHGGTVGLEFNF